jgi:RNA polymerase sigma-70 factor (ECF subfamily)
MPPSDDNQQSPPNAEHTSVLLGRIRSGDRAAREILFARYLPLLKRWARHRLPQSARDLRDTDDLVQDTLLRALGRLEGFENRGEGAFLAYLRQSLLNAIRDDLRNALARPRKTEIDEALPDPRPSTLDEVIGRDRMERFERALATLTDEQREAIVLRIEFGFSHQQVAEAIGKPTANAARMTVARALVELAKAMHES